MQVQDTPSHVVAWDPQGEFWEGAIIDHATSRQLDSRARGLVSLPCVPDLFRHSGVGGYAKRSWGAGIPLDTMSPSLVAPITLFCVPDVRGLTWRARLVPDIRADGREVPRGSGRHEGMVRFSADSGQRTPVKGSYTEVDERPVLMREFGEPDAWGGWTIGGQGHVSISGEGHYGYSLYATAPGYRVAWVAATLCPLRMR
jgi:hypothetical protein